MCATEGATATIDNPVRRHSVQLSRTHGDTTGPSPFLPSNQKFRWDRDRKEFGAQTAKAAADEQSSRDSGARLGQPIVRADRFRSRPGNASRSLRVHHWLAA